MGATTAEEPRWPELQRARRAIVVVDVVESVRLMQQHEDDVIDRWRRFVHEVRTEVLPPHGGRLVKSLGDGMLLEFGAAAAGMPAALDLQQRIERFNADRGEDARLRLRVGAHLSDVVVDDIDIYGAGVNFAARLAGLAGPGEIVVSVEWRDALLAGVDAEFEDLGMCYLKHMPEPRRAFRVRAGGAEAGVADSVLPLLCVVPLALPASGDATSQAAAGALVDSLALVLSRQPLLRVTSRLTTRALSGRSVGEREWRALQADYLVSGSLLASDSALEVTLRLTEASNAECLWEHAFRVSAGSMLNPDATWAARAAEQICAVLLSRHMVFAHAAPLPNLPGYALLLQALGLLHRLSREDAVRAGEVLEHLADRHPRAPEARAWLAHWHLLQVAQNWSTDRSSLDTSWWEAERALEIDPTHPLALTLRAHLLAFRDGQPEQARAELSQVVERHPNEALSWAFLGNALTHLGQGEAALSALQMARSLSPLDPFMFLVELCTSSALSTVGRHQEALEAARRSVRWNCLHLSSLVQLIVAAAEAGDMPTARATAQRYLQMRPSASVQRFLDHHVARDSEWARRQGEALLEAGIPR